MDFKVKKQELKNGLTMVSVPMKTESVTILLSVRVGSRDEAKEVNGVSHFLEHMVFKGTKKWPTPMRMNQVIDAIGGQFNAYTSRENTAFWVKIAKEHLKLGLEYLNQAVFHSLLPAEELEKERGVILEEIKMYEDNPMSKVSRDFVAQVYSATPLGRHVIGTSENIRKMKRKDFEDHVSRWYRPKNMVLGMAGGVDGEVSKLAEEVFAGLPKGEISFKDKPERVELVQSRPVTKVTYKDIQQAHFCLGMEGLGRDSKDEDRYSWGVMNQILGGNTSSRLWNEIREKRGLVYYVRSYANAMMDTGYQVVQAGCDVNRVEEAIKVTLKEHFKVAEKGVTKKELKIAKDNFKGRMALDLEDSKSVAGMFTDDLLMEGKIRSIKKIVAGVEKVTREDVQRVAEKMFNRFKLHLTVVGPFKDKSKFEKLLS